MTDSMTLSIAIFALAIAVVFNAIAIWRSRPRRKAANLISGLQSHNQALTDLLTDVEARKLLAEITAREGALLGFIGSIENSIDLESDPIASAKQIAAQEQDDEEGFFKRQWKNLKEFGKPVAETVFGKANGYIKKYVGAGEESET